MELESPAPLVHLDEDIAAVFRGQRLDVGLGEKLDDLFRISPEKPFGNLRVGQHPAPERRIAIEPDQTTEIPCSRICRATYC